MSQHRALAQRVIGGLGWAAPFILAGVLLIAAVGKIFALALALLCSFTLLLIYNAAHRFMADCFCFGKLRLASDARTANRLALVRNALLLVIGAIGVSVRHPSMNARVDIVTPPRRDRSAAPAAFTLAEMLVVIGAVGLLIAILLPAIAATRARAQSVNCASNLRQIATLASGWASEHRGFLPLDGEVEIDPRTTGYGSLPHALDDPSRVRYGYDDDADAPTATHPATHEFPRPFLVSLATQLLGRSGDSNSFQPTGHWSETERLFPQLKVFRCPAAHPRAGLNATSAFEGGPTLTLIVGDTGYEFWWTDFDYATNGGLLGFHFDHSFDHRRYRGKLSAVKRASTMVLCADSGGWRLGWVPALKSQLASCTLVDVLNQNDQISSSSPFDTRRHHGRMNIAFVDGHVESAAIDSNSLSRVDLLQR